ncbi:MAG TPA: MraY family glycosyltransferase [Thermoanaerobaculia bacterium]|nr:MraY family glycosyltransferase [Thermoanaerobaculia bacterium]
MSSLFFSAGLAALIAGVVTDLCVPPVERLARFLQALDQPDDRKQQTRAIPRLGGVALFVGLSVAAVGVVVMGWDRGPMAGRSELVALAIGTLMVGLLGVVDDLVGATVAKKFLVEICAAFLVVQSGWSFQVVSLPGLGYVHLGLWGDLVAVLWIVGVTNAINLLDGLDGLAGGVVAIMASGLAIYSALIGNALTAIGMGAMAGACLGFLRHNWAPAKIFMGDSGSLTLGFLLGSLSVFSSLKAPTAVAMLVPVLALGLPVMDTLVVMAVRFLGISRTSLVKRVAGMFQADRKHLHHKLEEFSSNRRRIVVLLYLASLLFCAMALLVAATHNALLGVALVVTELVAVLLLRNLRRMGES